MDEESISYQTLRNNEYYLRDEYNLKSMILTIKEDNSLLEKYPQLQYFFNKDGSLKNEIDLLKAYSLCDNDTRTIYYEFFTYIYGLGDYRDVTNNLSIDLMEIKYNIIKELLKQETNFYKVLDSLDDNSDRAFERTNFLFVDKYNEEVMELRKERIANYCLFLQNYKLEMKFNNKLEDLNEINDYIELAENILHLNNLFIKKLKNDINFNNKLDNKYMNSIDYNEIKQIINNILLNNLTHNDDNKITDKFLLPSNRHL